MARRTQAQLAQTRQDIILAAQQLFAEKGFAHTTVADLAAAAGIGMSAFYGQFKDKDELYILIVDAMFQDLHSGVLTVRRNMSLESPLDAMRTNLRIYTLVFEKLLKHQDITLSVLRSGYAAVPRFEALYWAICDAVANEMSRDLALSEDAGLIQVESHRDFADATVGMILQLAHRMAAQGSPTPAEAARICTRMTMGGLLLSMPADVLQRVLPLLTASSPETATAVRTRE